LYYPAKKRNWKNSDFTLEKCLLRAKYGVNNTGISNEIKKLNTHDLKEKLVSFCKVLNYKKIEVE